MISQSDLDLIRNSGLVDSTWYIKQYPDVAVLGMDAVEHYVFLGAKMGRDPSSQFNTGRYLADNPEVALAGTNPLLHFIQQKHASAVTTRSIGRSANGRVFQQLVQEAWNRPVSAKKRADFELIKPYFDMEYYLRQYADVAHSAIHPIVHYLDFGGKENRDPSPFFVTKYYVNRYPDVNESGLNPLLHYIKTGEREGRSISPFSAGDPNFDRICEELNQQPQEMERELFNRRADIRQRLETGVLGEMVQRAAELEPLIQQSRHAARTVRFFPFHAEQMIASVAAMYRLHEAAGFKRTKMIIVHRGGGVSGASRLAGRLAWALSEIYGAEEVVVLQTDQSEPTPLHWFPENCRQINLLDISIQMSEADMQRLLVEFLRSLRPEGIFNVNSRLLWDALLPYGKALKANTNLYAYLFCNEQDIYGDWFGYPDKYFYRYFDLHTAIFTDSVFLNDDLRTRFLIPPGQVPKLVPLTTPIHDPLPQVVRRAAGTGATPQVFWAGRFDRQKRLDIVLEIAAQLPGVQFRLWGSPQLDRGFLRLTIPPNVSLEGTYDTFCELPLDECDLWLYTSEWDGVPNVLLEVSSAGIPIVGSTSGGCVEVLSPAYSETISDVNNVEAFTTAIERIITDPQIYWSLAAKFRKKIIRERSADNYKNEIANVLMNTNNK